MLKAIFMRFSILKLPLILLPLVIGSQSYASGGYDNGTPAGQGNWNIDLTLNPADIIENGQSYIVWGYGLTDHLDFHGYASHEAGGTNQLYYGLMYNFYSNDWMDLSSAVGARHRLGVTDVFFPQALYTIKLPGEFDIIGSVVNVYNTSEGYNRGVALDVALRIPVSIELTPSFVKDIKFAIGAFRGAGGETWYPTYSIDIRF